MKKFILQFIIVVLMLIILPFNHAKAGVSLNVSPTSFEVGINPGDKYENIILITNNNSEPVSVKAFARGFKAAPEGTTDGIAEFSDNIPLPPTSQFALSFSPSNFTLDPQETREVTFVITTTKTAAGGYYVGGVFETIPDKPDAGQVAQVIQNQINVPILTRVGQSGKETAEIKDFLTEKSTYSFGPVNFNLSVKNTGNIHYAPIGRVEIFTEDGKQIDTIQVKGNNIIPNDIRKTVITWNKRSLPLGKKKATVILFWGNQKLTKDTTFEVLPGNFASTAGSSALIIGGLIIIFAFLSRRKKRSRRRPSR